MAIDLRLRFGNGFPADGINGSVRIREGSPTGQVRGTSTSFVVGPHTFPEQQLVPFDFAAIQVTPGQLYVIEFVTPQEGSRIWSWLYTSNNPYTFGNLFNCDGLPGINTDFNFRIHARR